MTGLEQKTIYKAEVMSGDLLHRKSKILEAKDKAIKFIHFMYNSEHSYSPGYFAAGDASYDYNNKN